MAATIKAEGAHVPDLHRYSRLARGIQRWVEGQYYKRRGEQVTPLIVGIETPVMKSTNVTNYRKQVSTILAIELYLAHVAESIVEINPTSVKMAATNKGDATKAEMVAASPLRGTGASVEAMADAWAVALATRLRVADAVSLYPVEFGQEYTIHTEEIL